MKIIVSGETYVDCIVWSESQSIGRAWPLDTPAVCQRKLHWRDRRSGALGVVEILRFMKWTIEEEIQPSTCERFVWRAARSNDLATDIAAERTSNLRKPWRLVEAVGWGPTVEASSIPVAENLKNPCQSVRCVLNYKSQKVDTKNSPDLPNSSLTVRFGALPQAEAIGSLGSEFLIWRPAAAKYDGIQKPEPFWKSRATGGFTATVIVVDSDYLRLFGEPIGKRLSLDQAVDQVSNFMMSDDVLKSGVTRLVVCLGPFACLYYSRKTNAEQGWNMVVLFLPRFDVDRFGANSGSMTWFDEWMVAELANNLSITGRHERESMEQGLKAGLRRTSHLAGGVDTFGDIASPDWQGVWSKYWEHSMPPQCLRVESVRYCLGSVYEGAPHWVYGSSSLVGHELAKREYCKSPAEDNTSKAEFDLFLLDVVNLGIFTATDGGFPVVRFGNLILVDRNEIDHYRGLRNLLEEYLLNPNWTKPLSIAVFGPPGSGKSFGVTEIAQAMSESFNLDRRHLVFNLSQFESSDDLSAAFHRVQDACLDEKIPIAFFDEFDSDKEGQPLGWLKHFLMPMQDGEFTERGATHKLKKCILVFAGGTSRSYEQFSAKVPNRSFVEAKGPDFLSRLRGHVNNKGLSLLKASDDAARTADRITQLRRAIFLRSLLKAKLGYRSGGEEKNLKVNEDFIRPFLYVEDFRHGMRSVEAIIQMCQINDLGNGLNRGSLPIASLLDMHVDAIKFRAAQRQ